MEGSDYPQSMERKWEKGCKNDDFSVSNDRESSSASLLHDAGNLPFNSEYNQEEESEEMENDNEKNPLITADPLLEDATLTTNGGNKCQEVRSRNGSKKRKRKREDRRSRDESEGRIEKGVSWVYSCLLFLCRNTRTVQSTISCMNLMARLLFWTTIVASVGGVFWFSFELFNHGTEPHLIAWFSSGAFVLLGFPVSMYGIMTHLANYNQPETQMYVVRILWMVPVYSIESWLAMRFHKQAIYIETLRDFYESYVLYSFLQFLISVLGGEEALVLLLKDKSPTRGYHMWGLQWCMKPWIMGQPFRKATLEKTDNGEVMAVKKVHWVSPFYVNCKFGVLQYVLLKLVCAIVVLILEWFGLYNEGDFSWSSGYLYICILTNLSQCWALYCLIIFYYATKNELGPIRPVGKFLSVKALVFFTWWQSVIIAILYQAGMIPEQLVSVERDWTTEDVVKGFQDYLICIEMFIAGFVHFFVFPHTEFSPEAVAARTNSFQSYNIASSSPPSRGSSKRRIRRLGRSKFHPQPYTRFWGSKDDRSKSSALPSTTGLELMTLDSTSVHTMDFWEDKLIFQESQPQYGEDNGNGTSLENGLPVDPLKKGMVDSIRDFGGALGTNRALSTVKDVTEYEEDEENQVAADELSGENTSFAEDETEFVEGLVETPPAIHKPGFVKAFIESTIPSDLGTNTLGIVKGDYHVEKKTLLHVATASDQYDLLSPNRRRARYRSDSTSDR